MWVQNGQLMEKSEIKNTSFMRIKTWSWTLKARVCSLSQCYLHIFLRYEMFSTGDSEIKMVKYHISAILI